MRPKSRRRYTCLIVIFAILGLLFISGIIGVQWLRSWLTSNLSSERLQEIHDAETLVVKFPPDWHHPAPLPPTEVLDFFNSLEPRFTRILSTQGVLLTGSKIYSKTLVDEKDTWTSRTLFTRSEFALPPLDDDQRESYTQLLEIVQPLQDEATTVTALSGYSMADADPGNPGFMHFQTFAKLMRVKASIELEDGHARQAIETAALPMATVQRENSAASIHHTIATAVTAITASSFNGLAQKTKDADALRHGMELMDKYRPYAVALELQQLQFCDWYYYLRRAVTKKAPVDLSPQTRSKAIRQWVWLESGDYCQWQIQHLPAGHPDIAKAQVKLNEINSRSSSGGWDFRKFLGKQFNRKLPTDSDRPLYRITKGLLGIDPLLIFTLPNNSLQERMEISQALYDLARLRLAQQLALAEGKMDMATSPTASAVAVAEYINPIPLDPFTSAPFKLSPQGQFYSVGPDKTDDHAATPYDRTSVIASPGDIYFLPPKDPRGP